jgi:regulator of cell morphogenesis and NO signaling
MVTNTLRERSLGEIVVDDFRSANIFMEAGIDFCCGGKKTLEQACEEKNLDLSLIVNRLQALETSPSAAGLNFKDWPLDFLCDYLVNTHHTFVKKAMPDLVHYTQKIASVHGEHHPELIEVAGLFNKLNDELTQHLNNEEEILFPAIKAALKGDSMDNTRTIRTEIERMHGEHEFAGGAMDQINLLTRHYQVPDDGCNTYHVTFKLLRQFEDDLHVHVHLENNILFPKAIRLSEL